MTDLPLKGVRVVDMGRVYAGPMIGKMLLDMGAEVIKVESIQRLDLPNRKLCYPDNDPGEDSYNRGGWFHWLNTGKMSITLDLSDSRGVQVFKRLVRVSDVVLENFSPRVMSNLGIDYDVLRQIRPDLIMVSLSGYGHTGPHRDRPAYAWAFEGASGFQSVTGFASGPPMMVGTGYGDWALAMNGVAAILLALLHRRKKGEGQYIDIAGQEVVAHHLGEVFMDCVMNGRAPERVGNADNSAAPHGCYRCKGEDQWIAIAIRTDPEWKGLCTVMGDPPWSMEDRFQSALSRLQHREELDQLVEEWSKQSDHYELMHRLQDAGVPAGAVLNPKEVLLDPHLRERGFFQIVEHPGAGKRPMPRLLAAKFGLWSMQPSPAPRLGEHNRQVLHGLIGMSHEEIGALEEAQVIGTVPIGHSEAKDRGFNIPFIASTGSASYEPDYRNHITQFYDIS